jgi:hypothetical protein
LIGVKGLIALFQEELLWKKDHQGFDGPCCYSKLIIKGLIALFQGSCYDKKIIKGLIDLVAVVN